MSIMKVGAAALEVDQIFGAGDVGIPMRADGGSDVTPGAEAHDADALPIDIPGFGVGSDQADGALAVEHGNGLAVGSDAVFKHEGGDAVVVQPMADIHAFVTSGQVGVTTTGADDDGAAIGFGGVGQKFCEGGDVGIGIAQCARGLVGPQTDHFSGAWLRSWVQLPSADPAIVRKI